MDKKTWVVAANSTHARIFDCETVKNWNEIDTLIHPQSRLHNRDLASDKAGRYAADLSCKVRSAMNQQNLPKTTEMKIFAKELAKYLENARNKGMVQRIFIAASPTFLGYLRNEMGNSLLQIIDKTVDKDITHSKPEKMRDYFFVEV